MIVVGPSVFVAALSPSAADHRASVVWLREADAAHEPLAISGLTLADIAGPLARSTGDSRLAQDALDWVLGFEGLEVHPVDFRRAAVLAADLQIDGADAWGVELADRLRAPLVTWDRTLVRSRAAEVIEILTPDDWPEWL